MHTYPSVHQILFQVLHAQPALYQLAFVSSAVCRMRIITRKILTYDQAKAVSSLPFACVAAGFLAVSGVSLTHDYAFR
jgi:hypothetical protein